MVLIGCITISPDLFAGTVPVDLNWFGIIPAILAIFLAIFTKQVILSLLVGLVVGSVIQSSLNNSETYFFGIENVFDHYLLNSIADKGHAAIILFSLLIASSVHIMTKMGAFNGLIKGLSKYAKSKRSALMITYFMGFFVFFDDYANTLVVGSTMQRITDRFKISREKLAFIVDATAAPIASIAFVSTWIGYEIQLIKEGLENSNYSGSESAYGIFLNAVTYSFYPVLILVFVFMLILSGKDFGPMRKFESEKHNFKGTSKELGNSIHAIWAILPVLVLISVTIFGIYKTGDPEGGFINAIQTGDCYKGLIWGSASFFSIVFVISSFAKNTISENIDWMFTGMKSIFSALAILILAWALNVVLEDLHLGDYIGHLMTIGKVPFYSIPFITFVLSSIIAFSTGSSFSTMGILIPMVLSVCLSFYKMPEFESYIFYSSIASVLSGAVLGDHCSPISDTTVLSSLATGCDHINHVKSQFMYCLVCGGIASLLIVLTSVFNLNIWFVYTIGVVLIWLIIRVLGEVKNDTRAK